MVKQPKNYIKKRKQHFLGHTILWACIIVAVVSLGRILTHEKNNLWTVFAALCVLPLAQNLTRYLAFVKFNDPKKEMSEQLEHMQGAYYLYHSMIVPEQTGTYYYEHGIITARNIYFLTSDPTNLGKSKTAIAQTLQMKGVPASSLQFIYLDNAKTLDKVCKKIEKDSIFSDDTLDEKAMILEGILM
jgi:hypothetical protein